jgi:catechol 2,3-dioxygenase-like lactoylglutathione lyase family enzyme
MLTNINPKLPMRNINTTKEYYVNTLGFEIFGTHQSTDYLMVQKDNIQIHFFEHATLNPLENYGQVYIRVKDIDALYQSLLDKNVAIHPNGHLATKPWGQKEFSLLDPDHNLLTFGETVV